MASSSTQKPSSSSAPTPKCNFDVFLSFRGEDTRYNFTDHLFVNLDWMGIGTFRDDKLERGEEIAQELLGTIEGSRFSIIVFSEKYAHSKWCLDEFAKIMECRKEMDQIVLPVFYHVEPSDVRKKTESFEDAFAVHEKNVDKETVQRWRAAMTEAGNLGGWHVKDG
ncbi:TMV resistance protein N [Vitis vinifera]|uniref:ADP-ribosyl cyclase/cyclic ADP-ribose hydrolase n=2 Tax=Vitis vinifera TaxID=29760 RepID=A0A438IWA8_VITVI|nr:TMV resistance protein N [Vitis vinifera]|eukprot:XP_019081028.1 PREDICTED: TMV resistance protein N-like isoform X5 [Vitis vinifera]